MEIDLCAIAPADWEIKSVADVCQRITSGGTPSRREPAYYDGGIWPWVKTQELQDGWIDDTDEHITEAAVAASSARVLPANTILLAMYGATVGQLGILKRSMTCNQACCALIADPDKADFRFLYFQLFQIRSELKSLATGAAQQNLSGTVIKTLRLPFPPIEEQRAIAHILGTLDDKIELNRKQNKTLEAMANALFKAWFVDFEPVRAKMENRWQRGQSLPSLPAFLYDLFPDRLDDEGKPEGWTQQRVGDIGSIICGKTPPTKNLEYYGDDLPFITIPEMHGKIFATDIKKRLSHKGAHSQQKKMLPSGSICVSCIATLGLVVITTEPSQTNQQINSVIPAQAGESYFWYWTLKNLGEEIKAGGSGGSVLGNLSTGRFSELQVNAGSGPLRLAYNAKVKNMFSQILANEHESKYLAQLRDTLLPKLISGELRVTDAERIVGAAV